MALVIEDGSIVSGANSFATVAQARAYAALRGITTLPTVDADVEPLLINACDYLESLEAKYKGQRVDPTQFLSWPRRCVYLFNDCQPLMDTVIPAQLVNAQCQLAIDAITNDLQATGSGQEVQQEKIDTLEVTYKPRGLGTIQAQFNKALAILAPLFVSGNSLSVSRV